MIRTLFDNHVFIYILLALAGCGILMKLVVQVLYFRLLKASETMGTSKNKLAKNMKKKFEGYYKLKLGVNNVDIFVDKHFFHYKFCGIFLSTWEVLCGQVLVLSLLVGAISTILGLIYECGKNQILSTFTVGILTCGLLIFFEGVVNPTGKKEMIRLNMKDYLENVLKVRLVQEENQPELMEQYKKVCQPAAYTAVSKELTDKESLKPFHKKKTNKSREAKRLEKMSQKARQKDETAKKKDNKKLQAVQKKTQAQQQKNDRKEAMQKAKIEKERLIKSEKEAKKQEAAKLKAQALESEQLKREEKRHQKEIKKVLKLEKKQRGHHTKTTAQEKKENLLKEIQGRRSVDTRATEAADFIEKVEETENSTLNHTPEKREEEKERAAGGKTESRKENHFYEDKIEVAKSEEAKTEEAKTETMEGVIEEKGREEKDGQIKVSKVNLTEPKAAEVKAAKVRNIKARQVTVTPDITFRDDRTAAALEDGRSYKGKEYDMLRTNSEEDEKIIEDILKDIFS